MAERSGLIVPLGEWVLRTACQTAAGWQNVGVSVNVSPVQFRDSAFVGRVCAALKDSGLPPERLEIEVTEGVLLENADRALRMLGDLKSTGIKLAIDDFGTGYASLSYLRMFPFDVIKIDRQFTHDIEQREGGRAVVQAILALAKALRLSVTAEGVETDDQLTSLIEDECQEVQGFLLARPMGEGQMAELLDESGTTMKLSHAERSARTLRQMASTLGSSIKSGASDTDVSPPTPERRTGEGSVAANVDPAGDAASRPRRRKLEKALAEFEGDQG